MPNITQLFATSGLADPAASISLQMRRFNLEYIGIRTSPRPFLPYATVPFNSEVNPILEAAGIGSLWEQWDAAQTSGDLIASNETARLLKIRLRQAADRLCELQAGYDRLIAERSAQAQALSAQIAASENRPGCEELQARQDDLQAEIAGLLDARDVYIPGLLAGLAGAEALLEKQGLI